MTTLLIYFWAISDRLSVTLGLVSLIGLTIAVGLYIAKELSEKQSERDQWAKLYKIFPIKTLILLLALSILIPDKKDIAIVYIAPRIIESKAVREDLPELYDIGIKALKKELKKSAGIATEELGPYFKKDNKNEGDDSDDNPRRKEDKMEKE